MDGGQAPGGTWTSRGGGDILALAPTAAQAFNRVQFAFRSSQLNTAGPLFLAQNLCLMSSYFEMRDTLSNV